MSERKNGAPRGLDTLASKSMMKDFTLENLHLYRVNQHAFTIFVVGDPSSDPDPNGGDPGVDWNMANRLDMNLDFLSAINPQRPILIKMASPGGEWVEGLQMAGAILECPNPVTVLAIKDACSMASLIPLVADRFVIRPPAKYMIHRGSYGVEGIEQHIDTLDIERRKDNETMLRMYTARLREQGVHKRSSEKRIREMLTRRMEKVIDVWMTADEAVHEGFADDVFDGDLKSLRASKQNSMRRQRMREMFRKPTTVSIAVT